MAGELDALEKVDSPNNADVAPVRRAAQPIARPPSTAPLWKDQLKHYKAGRARSASRHRSHD